MATIPTQNAVPSEAPRDLKFNSGKIDEFVTSKAREYLDRFGKSHLTIEGMKWMVEQVIETFKVDMNQAIIAAGYIPMDSFQKGAEITKRNEILRDETTGEYYRWDGDLPKSVPAGSTPESAGGVGMGAWISVGDASLRGDLAKITGADLIGTESGKTVQSEIEDIYEKFNSVTQRCTHAANLLADGKSVIIECFGDSTMWGSIPGATTTRDPKNSPYELQATLNLMFPNLATVRNKALPGTNLESLLSGTDGGHGTFEARMDASDALVIFSNHCLNDCNSYQSDEKKYKDNLYTWVNIVRRYNKIPVIVTPTIISPTDDGKEFMMKRMPAFIQAQRDVASEMNVDLVDNNYYSYKTSRMFKVTDIAGDGVHLTQSSHQAAGRNMAIPLLEPHILKHPNDLSGLANSHWKDTISNARAIWKSDSRFGSMLSGDAISTPQSIYYPVVIDNPTDDTILVFGGMQGTAGGYGVFTYSGVSGDSRFSGIIDFKRSSGLDYDALFIPKFCRLGAGLHILGVTASTGQHGKNFTFSGAQLLPRREVSTGYPDGSGRSSSRLICTGDELRFSAYFAVDSHLQVPFSLKGCLDTDTVSALTVNNALGVLTVVAGGVATEIGTLTQSGFQDCRIVLSDDRTVIINIGGLSATSSIMTASLPTCYVSSPVMYSVRKL